MKTLLSFLGFLLLGGCVDRLEYTIKKSDSYAVFVDGFISNLPGPYQVNINRSFDIESKETIKTPVSARHVILMDDRGTQEELKEWMPGKYVTAETGIQGEIGRAYSLRIEFEDGKVYESIPDTILSAGVVESIYYEFNKDLGFESALAGSPYGFDVFASASPGEVNINRFMWSVTSTFQSETHPSPEGKKCYFSDGRCNFYPPCSGIRNVGSSAQPAFVRVAPCECCTCWYRILSSTVSLSDNFYSSPSNVSEVKVSRVPLSYWIFMHKVYVEVSLRSLSVNTFRFWKAVRDQKTATGSLFQPITGHIPVNFVQVSGEESPLLGIFFAAGVSAKSIFIHKEDVPDPNLIPGPPPTGGPDPNSCLEAFPNATNVKPDFWID